ncbi:KH domain-containing protein [Candidatus Beckwithbacteria bacterium]|nr:KH domain-containing protein [Candidatus Beckwithbacteria bacterium]
MQELLHYILEGIVDHPEDIEIRGNESEFGFINLEVKVNPEDMGKVIGKRGQTIGAIRKLLRVKAIKLGKRFQLTLLDEQQKD